ncbi:DHA2 family efflux MFS transporter permease subunit [Nocardia sp. CDC153]|uniref:DHA2 family efflux MFS transporter permease subunit n=1 Tax=Nocardia sp. CDC153 TaxID=3112167 RepID=UPI002DBB111B|nr:DHA2 family efflux MFS transporter permease subunit [Nocardia sp. CDC153]MEC3952691.1 DHA2 family efflux MFS transporter permease subunit [Nocardia sp. CDC153]
MTSSELAVDRPTLTPQARRAVVVVLIGAILAFLDATVVNVALKSLATDLGGSLDAIQWVVTAYLLVQAAVLPVTGWAARRVGAKRLYVVALLAFTLASVACAAAGSVGELVAARVEQGVGAGVMIPVGQMILLAAAGREGMARAMVAAGIPMVLTPVIGPTIGGLLLESLGWQWIFLINAPIGVVGLVLAVRLLPADVRDESARALDVFGLILVSVGMVGITYGLSEAASRGVTDLYVLVTLCGGTVLVAFFVVYSLRARNPILDLRLWRDGLFATGTVSTFVIGAVTFGAMVLLPLYFQLVRHQDAAHTGMLMAPQGIGAALAMVASARLYERIGALTCLLGTMLGCAATIPFMLLTDDTPYWLLGCAMVFRGLGIGLAAMPAMTAALRNLNPSQIIDATPQLTVMQRIGGSIGTAIFVVILQQHLGSAGNGSAAGGSAFASTFGWVLAASGVAVVPTLLMAVLDRGMPFQGLRLWRRVVR